MANICNNEVTIEGEEFHVDLFMDVFEKANIPFNYLERPDESPAVFHFESKWGPNLEVLAELSKQVPDVTIKVHYYEVGSRLRGDATIENGNVDDMSHTMSDEELNELLECEED